MAIYGIVIDKLLEITRDPFFEDIAWEYCVFGAVQMGEEEEGGRFFQEFRYGGPIESHNFFKRSRPERGIKLSMMGANTFYLIYGD